MPYIAVSVSKKVDGPTKDTLQKEIAGIIDVIPGKNVSNTTINITDGCSFYKELKPLEAAFVDVRLYKASPEESKQAFAEQLFGVIDKTLEIPPSNVQINFIEMPTWASGGKYF